MSDQTINLSLTLAEANLILAGLAELPAKHSLGLIQKVQQQAQEQLKPQAESFGGSE